MEEGVEESVEAAGGGLLDFHGPNFGDERGEFMCVCVGRSEACQTKTPAPFKSPCIRSAVATLSIPRHHGVVKPVVGQALVAVDSRVAE